MILITKPIVPTAAMPRKQIFIDCHSSDLPGFVANFNSRVTD
jgi:hypothetical protein